MSDNKRVFNREEDVLAYLKEHGGTIHFRKGSSSNKVGVTISHFRQDGYTVTEAANKVMTHIAEQAEMKMIKELGKIHKDFRFSVVDRIKFESDALAEAEEAELRRLK